MQTLRVGNPLDKNTDKSNDIAIVNNNIDLENILDTNLFNFEA